VAESAVKFQVKRVVERWRWRGEFAEERVKKTTKKKKMKCP
jgi:hypothetical protein